MICILTVPLGAFLIGMILSFLIRPVFVFRYIIPAISLIPPAGGWEGAVCGFAGLRTDSLRGLRKG